MCGTDNYPSARLCHRQPPVPRSGIRPLAGGVPPPIIPNEFGFLSRPPVRAVVGRGCCGRPVRAVAGPCLPWSAVAAVAGPCLPWPARACRGRPVPAVAGPGGAGRFLEEGGFLGTGAASWRGDATRARRATARTARRDLSTRTASRVPRRRARPAPGATSAAPRSPEDRGSYGADFATCVTQSCYWPVDPVGKCRQNVASRRVLRRFPAHDPQSRH